MAIQYTPIGWVTDLTSLSATNFNHMEEGIVNSVNAVNNILDGETSFSGAKTFDTPITAPGFAAEGFGSEQDGIEYASSYILRYRYGDEFLEAYFDLPDKPSGEYTLATMNDLWEYVSIDTDEEIEGQKTFKQFILLYDTAIDGNYHLGMNDDILEIGADREPIYFKIDIYNKCIEAKADQDQQFYAYQLPNESGTLALTSQVGTKLYKHHIIGTSQRYDINVISANPDSYQGDERLLLADNAINIVIYDDYTGYYFIATILDLQEGKYWPNNNDDIELGDGWTFSQDIVTPITIN